MLGWMTVILSCQLAGEFAMRWIGAPVPGPVAGMVLLLAGLALRGRLPAGLARTSDALLRHLSLLFVPAGTGIVVHLGDLREAAAPVLVALTLSTLAAILVAGWTMQRLLRGGRGPRG